MSLSHASVTASYLNDDGTPAEGYVSFDLTADLTNGLVTIVPSGNINIAIDASGNVGPVSLPSTLDPDTFPQDVLWRITERIDNSPVNTWFTPMPSGAVDLSDLRPQEAVG